MTDHAEEGTHPSEAFPRPGSYGSSPYSSLSIGINYNTLKDRLRRGWTAEKVLTKRAQ